MTALVAAIANYNSVLDEKDETIQTLTSQINQLEAALNGNITDYTSILDEKDETIQILTDQINQLETTLQANITDYKSLFDEKDETIQILTDQINQLEATLQANITDYKSLITSLNSQIADLENQTSSLEKEIEELKEQIEQLTDPTLHVEGTTLRNVLGNEVYLKSVNVPYSNRHKLYGTSSDCSSPDVSWFTEEDIQQIKALGGNCFEAHLELWSTWMPQRNQMNETYFESFIDTYLKWCKKYDIYIILNIRNLQHQSYSSVAYQVPYWFYPNGVQPTNRTVSEQYALDFFDTDNPSMKQNRDSFVYMWKWIADRYKDEPYIIFSPMNEPLCGNSLINDEWSQKIGKTYSILMERVVDAIKSTGAKQPIIIDRPYIWYLENIQPINRTGIIWEDHVYVTQNTDINDWKDYLGVKIQRFVYDFDKPLFIGEYGTSDPVKPSNWKDALSEEVTYLKNKMLCGRQWHSWDHLEGEYMDMLYDYFNSSESLWITRTIFG